MWWLRRAVGGLFAVCLILTLLEVGLRGYGWPRLDPARLSGAPRFTPVAADLHFEPFPSPSDGGTFRVSTDAQGLRAPLHTRTPPEGVCRIVTLGGSASFGWGVDDESTYPARLEQILAATGRRVEVVNGGQPGASSFSAAAFWDRVVASYQPDVVVWGYLAEDAETVPLSERTAAALRREPDLLVSNPRYRFATYRLLRDLAGQRELLPGQAAEALRVTVPEYEDHLRALAGRVGAAGARLVLFAFPMEEDEATGPFRDAIRRAAADPALGAPPLYDPQTEFVRQAAQESLSLAPERRLPNAAGFDLIARGLAAFLLENDLVP